MLGGDARAVSRILAGMAGPVESVEAWRLKTERGLSDARIAEILDIDIVEVRSMLDTVARQRSLCDLETERALEFDKLGTLEQQLWDLLQLEYPAMWQGEPIPGVTNSKAYADLIGSVLKVMERRAKLTGLDAPSKSQTTQYNYAIEGVDPSDVG